MISQSLGSKSVNVTVIEFTSVYKSQEELNDLFSTSLETDYARDPVLVRKGENFAGYILGEHDQLYFSLRRIEF